MAFKERITIKKLPILDYALTKMLTKDEYKKVEGIMNDTYIPDLYMSAISLCLFAMVINSGMAKENNIQEFTSFKKIIPPSIDVFTKWDVINSKKFNEYAEIYNKYHPTEEEKKSFIDKYMNEGNLLTLDELEIIRNWFYDDFKPTNEEKYILFKAFYFTWNQSEFIKSSIGFLDMMKDAKMPHEWRNMISSCIKVCINKISSAYANEDEIIQEIRILNERMCIY